MPVYIGTSSKSYTTGKRIGKGGEGEIYHLQGNTGTAIKVLHTPDRTDSKKQKLSLMLSQSKIPERAAWPKEIVFENGSFAGYVMPKISNCKPISEIYVADSQIGDLNWRIAVGHYLCDAVDEIHTSGQVCGDLNPANIFVSKTGWVTLIDTDSFHIQNPNNPNRPFRCEKGLGEWIAPELQPKMNNGQTLAIAPLPTFTKETDHFAVAVHLFALFMNGCHPFATRVSPLVISQRKSSATNPLPNENIAVGKSPFFTSISGFEIPDYAPPLSSLPKEMQNLFYRAFVDGHINPLKRPSCREWCAALMKWHHAISGSTNKTTNLPKKPVATPSRSGLTNKTTALPKKPIASPSTYYAPPSTPAQSIAPISSTSSGHSSGYWVRVTVAIILAIVILGVTIFFGVTVYQKSSSMGDNSYVFSNEKESIGGWETNTLIFNKPIVRCTGFLLKYSVTDVQKGSAYDLVMDIWIYHSTAQNVYEWDSIGSFNVNNANQLSVNFRSLSVGYTETTLYKIAVLPQKSSKEIGELSWGFDLDVSEIKTQT